MRSSIWKSKPSSLPTPCRLLAIRQRLHFFVLNHFHNQLHSFRFNMFIQHRLYPLLVFPTFHYHIRTTSCLLSHADKHEHLLQQWIAANTMLSFIKLVHAHQHRARIANYYFVNPTVNHHITHRIVLRMNQGIGQCLSHRYMSRINSSLVIPSSAKRNGLGSNCDNLRNTRVKY